MTHYTVNMMAKIAGVSIRTLHYYDKIGLLKPSGVRKNGYRYYGEKELAKLQQILFFRELEFPLADIAWMVNAPNFNAQKALKDQKKLLELKRKRIENLLTTIEKTLKGGETMTTYDMFGSFDQDTLDKYKEEAKARWGNTDAWKQSQRRTKGWTKTDYARIAKKGAEWTKKLAELRDKGCAADSPEIQEMIDQHYNGLRTFYEPNYEMYKGLGQMYVDDPRFSAYYEKFGKGLAVFMRDAMCCYADKRGKRD